jgi:Na+/H+-dicarboxylate symporter
MAAAAERNIGMLAMKPFGGGRLESSRLCLGYVYGLPNVLPIAGVEEIWQVEDLAVVAGNPPTLTEDDLTEMRHIEESLRQALIGFFAAIANATTVIIDWIILVAPIGIFSLVLAAASRAGVALAGAMAYYVIAISAALVLFALLMYPVATTVGRIPLGWFTRAVLPAQAVALSSSSSLASLPALIEGARALGMPTTTSGFVLPLSVSVFKVATTITWLIGTLFLAKLYGVTLGTTALVTIAIAAVGLSLTIPGVPQGAHLLLAPLLVRYGIPAEGIALLIAVDTIPDLAGTMTNVTGDFVVAAVVSRQGVAESADEAASSADA